MIPTLLRILDSSPSRPKNRKRGQSLVEIAVTTPILFFLITGLMEVGFLAANYIILTDALRTGARFGVTQDITQWPEDYTRNALRTGCYGQTSYVDYLPFQAAYTLASGNFPAGYVNDPVNSPAGYSSPGDDKQTNAVNWRLFDGVACQVINNMQPLNLDPNADDIAVSVLSYTGGDPSAPSGPGISFVPNPSPYRRYPLQNSYCANSLDDVSGTDYTASGQVVWNKNTFLVNKLPASADGSIRGFVLTGHMHPPDQPTCIGSYFYVGSPTDTSDYNLIYQLRHSASSLNPTISAAISADLGSSPNGGLIVTEILYHHHVLLGFPPFNLFPSFALHLWSIFPQFSAVPPLNSPGSPGATG